MRRYADLLADALRRVAEIQPWDLSRQLAGDRPPLVLDVRNRTASLAVDLVESLFGKSTLMRQRGHASRVAAARADAGAVRRLRA